jgi:hypothetical protein
MHSSPESHAARNRMAPRLHRQRFSWPPDHAQTGLSAFIPPAATPVGQSGNASAFCEKPCLKTVSQTGNSLF